MESGKHRMSLPRLQEQLPVLVFLLCGVVFLVASHCGFVASTAGSIFFFWVSVLPDEDFSGCFVSAAVLFADWPAITSPQSARKGAASAAPAGPFLFGESWQTEPFLALVGRPTLGEKIGTGSPNFAK
jgi:hypothetical protein